VFEVTGWFAAQLTMLERRLDKALDLRVARERRLLHVEIELDLNDGDDARVDGALLPTALRVEASRLPADRSPSLAPPTRARLGF
jgi:hypothetical protein